MDLRKYHLSDLSNSSQHFDTKLYDVEKTPLIYVCTYAEQQQHFLHFLIDIQKISLTNKGEA